MGSVAAGPYDSEHLILRELSQRSDSGAYASPGFRETCLDKLDFILEAISRETEPFLYSDVDVRFYGPVVEDLLACLGDADMAFQWDGPRGSECTGFIVIRPAEHVLRFWRRVRDCFEGYLQSGPPGDWRTDQEAAHEILGIQAGVRTDVFLQNGGVRWRVLPERYWTYGRNDKHWEPGMPVNPPSDLLMHHASWTLRIENKLALLDAVLAAVKERA